MSSSGGGTVTVTVTVTIVVYTSSGIALPLLAAAAVGYYLAYVIAAAVGLIALVTFLRTISSAVATRDRRWLFDIAAAPLLASGLAWLAYPLYLRLIDSWLEFLRNGFADQKGATLSAVVLTLLGVVVYLGLVVVVFCLVMGAPFAAIGWMNSPDVSTRLLAYAAYAFTAFYWQTAVLAVSRGQGHW